jgi:hypothetical protein
MRKLVVKFSSYEAFESHVTRAEIGGADPVPSFFLYTSQVVKKLALGAGLARIFVSRPPAFEAILDPVRVGRANRAGSGKIAGCFYGQVVEICFIAVTFI